MQVINKIDQLIAGLTELKPALSDVSSIDEEKFNDLLKANMATGQTTTNEEIQVALPEKEKLESEIPNWVDLDYSYDPLNPRKPNMRELMEAIAEKDLEDLYAETDENWQKIRHKASDILYGVLGSNNDTRDWVSIMASDNILVAAREQTGVMYKTEVDIQSNFNDDGILTEQFPIIKDSKGNTLRSLSSDITSAEETLLNFGATKASIPTNLDEKIDPEKFDANLLTFLKNFDNQPASYEQIVIQNASEVIKNKLSQEIPLDELAKL